jgi:hypothetical protein
MAFYPGPDFSLLRVIAVSPQNKHLILADSLFTVPPQLQVQGNSGGRSAGIGIASAIAGAIHFPVSAG